MSNLQAALIALFALASIIASVALSIISSRRRTLSRIAAMGEAAAEAALVTEARSASADALDEAAARNRETAVSGNLGSEFERRRRARSSI